MSKEPLKIVTFNFLPAAYDLVTQWIHDNGHEHILAVTTPGPKSRPTPEYIGIVENAPRNVDILVTTRLRSVATPLIHAMQPDLIVCFSFPYRITPELCTIPRYGAVNLHPAVLPAYRGPNVFRSFYEGWPEFGATAHWIDEEYDTGNILGQKAAPLPEEVTPENIFSIWGPLISEALDEGLERAIAGDPGTPQDDSKASYAAPFTNAEMWLDLSESQRVIQRKVTALNFGPEKLAKVRLGDEAFMVTAVELLPQQPPAASPGECLAKNEESLLMQAADGPVRLQVESISEGNEA